MDLKLVKSGGVSSPTMKRENPDRLRHVRASFRKQKIMQFYDARITRLEKGLVEISSHNRQEYTQQDGYVHAGALVTLADSAGGYATLSLLSAGSRVLTVELKMNFLRPASGTMIRGRGHVKKIGRTISVVEIEVELKQGQKWVTTAWGVQTVYCIQPEPPFRIRR